MLLKRLLLCIIFTFCYIFAFSQTIPNLSILPFSGGLGGDGETIAQIFSIQREILDAFTVVPRTNAVNAILAEQNFQLSGYTDSDTIARIGRILNADFVVSGHIRRLGNRNLIIATIINVETFEQMAGDYYIYRNIEDIRNLLPEISKNLIIASQRDTSNLPKLAIAPLKISNDSINTHDAETLAQILAIEITNVGMYAVLPRTTIMQSALRELEYQYSGYTADEGIKRLGQAANADYVLSAEARSLGNINVFTAQILNVEDGSLLIGDVRDYRVIEDGIRLMAELALFLTDQENATEQILARNRKIARVAYFSNSARLWGISFSIGSSFSAPLYIGTIRGTIAPFRYSFLDIGLDIGFGSNYEHESYYSLFPFIHYAFFLPFPMSDGTKRGGWYIGTGVGFMNSNYTFNENHIYYVSTIENKLY